MTKSVEHVDNYSVSCDQVFALLSNPDAVKAKYDPEGLFFVHHGVGSEAWSADGFTRGG